MLFRDFVPAIHIESWQLATPMWDGDDIAGPVPTMFAEDEGTLANLLKWPAKLHGDLAKFGRLFGVVEHVEMEKALQVLRKPR